MEQNPLEYGYTLLAQEQVDAVCVQCYQKRMHAAARRQFAVLEELLQRMAAEQKQQMEPHAAKCSRNKEFH